MNSDQRHRQGFTLPGVIEANDLNHTMAVGIANVWKETAPDYQWCEADIQRFEGLTLTSVDGVQLRFAKTLCGYDGESVKATATILELFGFDTHDAIMRKIKHGGGSAHFTLSHPIYGHLAQHHATVS
jgi:hypothetical protein